jgi:hypothetical protein
MFPRFDQSGSPTLFEQYKNKTLTSVCQVFLKIFFRLIMNELAILSLLIDFE